MSVHRKYEESYEDSLKFQVFALDGYTGIFHV
jgi:hypothetical protein